MRNLISWIVFWTAFSCFRQYSSRSYKYPFYGSHKFASYSALKNCIFKPMLRLDFSAISLQTFLAEIQNDYNRLDMILNA